jgi:hypothetical protein
MKDLKGMILANKGHKHIKMVQVAIILTCIEEVSRSNLSQVTNYPGEER